MASIQDIYAANLQQPCGYPLHSPEPRSELGIPYDVEGFQIGDVGYVNSEGEFTPLFNICFPVPLEFLRRGFPAHKPIDFGDPFTEAHALPFGHVFTSGVRREVNNVSRPGVAYEFTAESDAGAVLILPFGATLYDLPDEFHLERFREAATQYGRLWCQCSKFDSLFLLTGMYKTQNFTLASFSTAHRDGKMLVKPDNGTHKWTTAFETYSRSSPPSNIYENQTILIKGFRMTVKWGWLHMVEQMTRSEPVIGRTISSLTRMASTWLSPTAVEPILHDTKRRCEELYDGGYILDAATFLLEAIGPLGRDIKADRMIMDWIPVFTRQCVTELERIGDQASSAKRHDEALAAYSTALSLAPSSTNALLTKWASQMLVHHSAIETFEACSKFKHSRFDAYRTVCDVLRDGHIQDAIKCFWQMRDELMADTSDRSEQAQWETDFRKHSAEQLNKLGESAMESHAYDEAVEHFSAILSLDPVNRMEVLIKRSKARASMKLWEVALSDADEAIGLDPSCHRGYEAKHAALLGAGRYMEGFVAFDAMISKLEKSECSDERMDELRNRYVGVKNTIRRIVEQTIRSMPRVLIDTTTGHLYDKRQQAEAFEALPIYAQLVMSMTTEPELDYARIWREVKKFYRYVMFSHRWQDGEPLLQKVKRITVYKLEVSPGNTKLQSFCKLANTLGFRWAWSDTCCVDKVNNVVLQESLVAMFSWYRGSSLTVIHLLGISSGSQEPGDLERSVWNTRAWTYQEYVASEIVQFYTEDWKPYLGLTLSNHKESPQVVSEMERVSGRELTMLRPGLERVREKLFLASTRQTTLVEDTAYSLLGVFNIAIPIIYGEGNRAVGRLLEHLLGDVTILAWTGIAGTHNSCLPSDLTVYKQLVPPHIPPLIETVEMDRIVADLRSSLLDLSGVMQLYDRLCDLPSPFIGANRLRLPGIVFRLPKFNHMSAPDSQTQLHIYRTATSTFGEIEMMTADDLTGTHVLYLVHPWIRPLLDQEFSDSEAMEDRATQALRLVARLRQPFGALLFKPLSRVEYKRVAADSLIMVQIRAHVPVTDLMKNIRTIEVQ